MESSDRDILISVTEILTDHIDQQNRVNQQLLRNQTELRAEIKQLNNSLIRNTARLDSIETYGGWLLGAITFMLAFSTFIAPFVSLLVSKFAEYKNTVRDQERIMREMIRDEIEQALKRQ